MMLRSCFVSFIAVSMTMVLTGGAASKAAGSDWPQWGGNAARSAMPVGENLPATWDVGRFDRSTGEWLSETSENIRYAAKIGSTTYGTPAIVGEKIFIATNNGGGFIERYPKDIDLGVLLCLSREDGHFIWQLSREKLDAGREADWPHQGICCTPMIQGDRAWVVTNRCEVICLDTEGFDDCVNDGDDSETHSGPGEADIVWLFDMRETLGVRQHNMASCSVTALGDVLFVHTSNGRDDQEPTMEAPDAPSFIALDKNTGTLLWQDASPGANVLHGQWASPAAAVLGDVPQVIFPGGDGWLYSFRGEATEDGKPELLWKFDCNPKAAQWESGGMGDRNNIIATPVIADGKVYIATGQDPEYGEGQGRLWCIDPTKRGDVSAELVVDAAGKIVPPRRESAVDDAAGEKVIENPNSAVVWCYDGFDANEDGERDFEETMHRTISMPAIADGLLVIPDMAGLIHCLDVATGKPYWTYDSMAETWGSATIADGKIFLGNCDGVVLVFELSKEQNDPEENDVGSAVFSTPVVLGDTIFVSTRTHIVAIGKNK